MPLEQIPGSALWRCLVLKLLGLKLFSKKHRRQMSKTITKKTEISREKCVKAERAIKNISIYVCAALPGERNVCSTSVAH